MAILTTSGRAAIAASIQQQPIHLAWGEGNPAWEHTKEILHVFKEDRLELEASYLKSLDIFKGDTAYVAGDDYRVDSESGVIDLLLKGKIPKNSPISLRFTQATPPEPMHVKCLLKEVGRRVVDEVLFCVPDPEGDLITPTGRFKQSVAPTNNLYLRFTFDFEEAAQCIIRELGVMVGTRVKEELPLGQCYFVPSDIVDPGILLVLENTVPLIRTKSTRESFTFVVTF